MSEYTPTTEEVRIIHIGTREEFAKPWQGHRAGEFDRWLAAHDAEVRAGVVAEEPEWEYGIRAEYSCGDVGVRMWGTNRDRIESQMYRWPGSTLVKRSVAGPWLPVEN